MDITNIVEWRAGQDYTVNDIVKVPDTLLTSDLWGATPPSGSMSSDTINYSAGRTFIPLTTDSDLVVSMYFKKGEESASLQDPAHGILVSQPNGLNQRLNLADTNAIGVGVYFYNSLSVFLGTTDLTKSTRGVSSDQLSSKEWFLVEKVVPLDAFPVGTAKVEVFWFVRGWKSGSFLYRGGNLSFAHPYFYCKTDHTSTAFATQSSYWTQDFMWTPSYGAGAQFNGINYSLLKEEGESFDLSQGINALPMNLGLTFSNRTDKETRAIIHFLQEKYFQYKSIYSLGYKGDRPSTATVGSFKFSPGGIYKPDQHFLCSTFGHDLEIRNNNTITAEFENITASELESVSSFNGYNPRTDLLLYIKFGGLAPYSVDFVKDTPKTLSIYTSTDGNSGVEPPVGSANCQSFKISLPPGSTTIDPIDSEGRDRVTFLRNYRKVKLSSTVTAASTTITLTPLATFTLSSASTPYFPFIIPCARGANSIYIDDADEAVWYPWLKLRSFPFKPSYEQSIGDTPRHAVTSYTEFYKKLYKVGPNQNLLTLNLTFDYRTEKEAKEILLFLEQHLGYRRFRFQLPRPYVKGDVPHATLAEKRISMFFCPSWDHEITFKDCHRVSATFIETPSGTTQEPFDLFNPALLSPCAESRYIPSLARYEICPPSSNFQAKLGPEFANRKNYGARIKSTDLVLVIDKSGSMKGNKKEVAANVAKQIIGTYRNDPKDDFIYETNVNAIPRAYLPSTFGLGSEMPDMEDVIAAGYDVANLEKFAIKIDQRRVNLGIVHFDDTVATTSALSPRPVPYRKRGLMESITPQAEGMTSFGPAMRRSATLLHQSDRVAFVQNRIVVFISDGMPQDGGGPGEARSLESGTNSLRLRRPAQGRAGDPNSQNDRRIYVNKVAALYDTYINSTQCTGEGESRADCAERLVRRAGFDPDSRTEGTIGNWADQSLPTIVFGVGVPGVDVGAMTNMATKYGPPGNQNALFYNAAQIAELIRLINIIINLTEDTGAHNYFSVVVKNCGPRPARIITTKVRFLSDDDKPRWTSAKTGGVLEYDEDFQPLTLTDVASIQTNPQDNSGGQYWDDPTNPKWPDVTSPLASNWLWKSGNIPEPGSTTKWLQLWRNGVRYDVDQPGGDANISSNWNANQGTDNVGVFAKGKYIRTFMLATDTNSIPNLQVNDLNISNVNAGNPAGDYEHLPELQPGESLDLFFTVATNRLFDTLEQIQMVFVTDDETNCKTNCYANLDFNLYTILGVEGDGFSDVAPPPNPPEPIQPPDPEPDPPPPPPPPPLPDPPPDGWGFAANGCTFVAPNGDFYGMSQLMVMRRYAGRYSFRNPPCPCRNYCFQWGQHIKLEDAGSARNQTCRRNQYWSAYGGPLGLTLLVNEVDCAGNQGGGGMYADARAMMMVELNGTYMDGGRCLNNTPSQWFTRAWEQSCTVQMNPWPATMQAPWDPAAR